MIPAEVGPVQHRDAEVSLIGAALSGYPDLDALLAAVDPSDFYDPAREEVWRAIATVHASGTKPDAVTVRAALDKAGVKHNPLALTDAAAACPLVGNAPHYAEQVVDAAGARAMQAAATRLDQLATAGMPLAELREEARAVVDAACQRRTASRARTLAQVVPGVVEQAEHGTNAALSTPWPDLNRIIGGLAPGRLVVIGARPGIGKSMAGTNLALHMAERHGHASLIASLEMPEREVGQRLLAAFAEVDIGALQHGTCTERDWQRIATKHTALTALPITVDDAPGQSVTSIRAAARDVQRTRGDLALIVVDYLQLLTQPSADRNSTEAQRLGEISRGLKLLARETGACVVAMVQVNREGTRHSDGRPKMTDLRGSGAIEADADQVLLLHQADMRIPDVEVIVDKNRHGPRGFVTLRSRGKVARLDSVAWQPEVVA